LFLALSLICILNAYGFYRMNDGDWINAVFFGLGILGIAAATLRP
jgi:hypothetical protein